MSAGLGLDNKMMMVMASFDWGQDNMAGQTELSFGLVWVNPSLKACKPYIPVTTRRAAIPSTFMQAHPAKT